MKVLLQRYVEDGLIASATGQGSNRSAEALPKLQARSLAIAPEQLSNAGLYDLLAC